jgi:hypothetical protein
MADSVTAPGKTPLNIEIRAGDAAGATFQTPLVVYTDAVLLQSVNISWAEIKAGLLLAISQALLAVNNAKMAFFIYLKTV